MNLKERYTSWRDDKRDTMEWLAYRLTHPISNYITENTEYQSYLRSASVSTTSRIYVSRVILTSVLIWIFLSIASNLILIPSSWVSSLVDYIQLIVGFTNIGLVFTTLIDSTSEAILSIIDSTHDLNIDELTSGIIRRLESIGESITAIGAVLLAIATILEVIIQPISDIITESLSQVDIGSDVTDSGQLTDFYDNIDNITPTPETIRNVLIVIIAPITALIYATIKLYMPIYVANERGRQIDNQIARSYTFMYALSEGGLDIYEVMKEIADSEDAYGEVSVTFRKIVRNANKGEESLSSAIRKVSDETPSQELEDFLNGLVSSIETGSNITRYIESQAERALDDAREKQENRINMYELISETYVILFVAAPVFFLILQLVQAMTGTVDRGTSQFVPYALIPIGGFFISSVVYFTSGGNDVKYNKLIPEDSSRWYDIENHSQVSREYNSTTRKLTENIKEIVGVISKPIFELKYNPKASLIITLPISILFVLSVIQLGFVPIGGIGAEEVVELDAYDQEMSFSEVIDDMFLEFTILVFYIPFLIVFIPWSILYEINRRRKDKVVKQLPQLFSSIAEANKRGLTMQESLESTSETSDTSLYISLRKSIRRSKVTNNINSALIKFANEVRVPRLSQSIRLLVKANKVSSNITVVVEAIADDLESYYALRRDRQQRVRIYVVIMFVAFLISSGVLIALDVMFLDFITEETGGDDVDTSGAPDAAYGSNLPIGFFQRVFLHTLISLGIVSGIVAGMMENGNPQNGFKYAIVMVTFAILSFIIAPVVF